MQPRSIRGRRPKKRERRADTWSGWKQAESPSQRRRRRCSTCWVSPRTMQSSSSSANRRQVCLVDCGVKRECRHVCARSLPLRSGPGGSAPTRSVKVGSVRGRGTRGRRVVRGVVATARTATLVQEKAPPDRRIRPGAENRGTDVTVRPMTTTGAGPVAGVRLVAGSPNSTTSNLPVARHEIVRTTWKSH
jgi:hypothetical protein